MCFDGTRKAAEPLMRAAGLARGGNPPPVAIPEKCPACRSTEITRSARGPAVWFCWKCRLEWGDPPAPAPPPAASACPACGSTDHTDIALVPPVRTCRNCGWRGYVDVDDGLAPPEDRGTHARAFGVGDKVVKDPAGWQASEFDGWGAGEGVGEVVDAGGTTHVDVRWPKGRAYQLPSELLPAPTSSEDQGTPAWVWRDADGWWSYWRLPRAVERVEVTVPIGWRFVPDPEDGVVLGNVWGNKLTAVAVLHHAERGEGGFKVRGREAVG